jgi:hypothetical protein
MPRCLLWLTLPPCTLSARELTKLGAGAVLERGLGAFLLFPSSHGRMLLKPLATHELMLPSHAEALPDPSEEAVAAVRSVLQCKMARGGSEMLTLPSRGILRHASDRADLRAADGGKSKRSKKSNHEAS